MRRAGGLLLLVAALAAASAFGGGEQGKADVMLKDAPPKANALRNPYEGRADAVQAGAKLFRRHCAKCHGEDAGGSDEAPDLRTRVVENTTPGALFWFLKNGSLRSGMPSWSGLPEQQRWQLVSYLKTLKPPEKSDSQ
jgi:mono/diheme cytochrome c family protein